MRENPQAKRKGRQLVRLRAGEMGSRPKMNYTLDEAHKLFLHAKSIEGVKERTILDYEAHHKWFTEWLREAYPAVQYVHEISTQILRDYIYFLTYEKQHYTGHPTKSEAEKNKRGLKPASVNLRINTMKAFYRWLHNEGLISSNPAANIKKQPVEEDTIGAFTDEQVELLLSAPDQRTFSGFRDYVMMRLLLESGMRIKELLSLQTEDIDLGTRLITLPASINKNRKARVIPISREMVKLLIELINENKTFFPEQNHIFLTTYGDVIAKEGVAERLKMYANKVGISNAVRCSPHTFRHTFALNFLKAGADIIALQRILGHSSMDMVRKYVQHTNDDLLEAHDKFTQARLSRNKRK
jgi:integrase/recombinase XerD